MARIEVLWEDETGTPRITCGKLEDKSRAGTSVRVEAPISVGTRLIIQGQSEQFSGTVIYCRRDHSGHPQYALGIQRDPADIPDPK